MLSREGAWCWRWDRSPMSGEVAKDDDSQILIDVLTRSV